MQKNVKSAALLSFFFERKRTETEKSCSARTLNGGLKQEDEKISIRKGE
jgi:hypothetical protein